LLATLVQAGIGTRVLTVLAAAAVTQTAKAASIW
jgi:hypothetical protein